VSASLSSGVVAVYSASNAFCAVKDNGDAVAWGSTNNGGNSSGVSLVNIKTVTSSWGAFAALKTNGTVLTWGNSSYGGNSSSVSSDLTNVVSIYSNVAAFAALRSDGSVVTWGNSGAGGDSSTLYPNDSSISSGVVAIYSTSYAFAALKIDGSVVCWGNVSYGGNPDSGLGNWTLSSMADSLTGGVVSVYSTDSAFAALKSNGGVITWGNQTYGGNSSSSTLYPSGSSISSNVVSIFSNKFSGFTALKRDGNIVSWGGTNVSSLTSSPSNVVSVCSTYNASAAISTALRKTGLTQSYFTNDERCKILSSKELGYAYNTDALSTKFTISANDLITKANIKVPASNVMQYTVYVPR